MNQKFTRKKLMVFIITVFLASFYASFLTADILTGDSDNLYSKALKYCCILLCFLLTIIIGQDGHDFLDTWLLRIALFFTAIADFAIWFNGSIHDWNRSFYDCSNCIFDTTLSHI